MYIKCSKGESQPKWHIMLAMNVEWRAAVVKNADASLGVRLSPVTNSTTAIVSHNWNSWNDSQVGIAHPSTDLDFQLHSWQWKSLRVPASQSSECTCTLCNVGCLFLALLREGIDSLKYLLNGSSDNEAVPCADVNDLETEANCKMRDN